MTARLYSYARISIQPACELQGAMLAWQEAKCPFGLGFMTLGEFNRVGQLYRQQQTNAILTKVLRPLPQVLEIIDLNLD